MTIFMDRHEMHDATAEKVAEAHRRDLAIQDQYDVKYMMYWFDQKRGTVFCLVEAPDAATAKLVHRAAHGDIPATIIPVDPAAVEAFLGRIDDPTTMRRSLGSGVRAVMFTDLVGSTEVTQRLGDMAGVELVRAHDAMVRRALRAHHGREVKHTGDGIMAVFDTATDAALAAIAIQRSFRDYNAEAAEKLNVRIGIHAGEPVEDRHDLFGATVQLASRLCDEAAPNEIVVSDLVCNLCRVAACRFVPRGKRRVKGMAEPLATYRLDWQR